MRELERTIRVINLPSGRKYFVVSRVRNQFFVEAFPQKIQSNSREVPLPPNPPMPEPTSNAPTSVEQSTQRLLVQNELNAREESESYEIENLDGQSYGIDVLIITALPEERDELIKCKSFPGIPANDWIPKVNKWGYDYYQRSFQRNSGSSFTVAIASAIRMGERDVTWAATLLASQLKPRCLAMVGICAGNRKEGVKLGDIVVADRVFDCEFGKLKAYYEDGWSHHSEKSLSPYYKMDLKRREEKFYDLMTYNLTSVWIGKINNLSQKPINWIEHISSIRPRSYEHQSFWLRHRIYEYRSNPNIKEVLEKHPDLDRECPSLGKVIEKLWKDELLVKGKLKLTEISKEKVIEEQSIGVENRDHDNPRIHLGPIGTSKNVIRDPKIFDYLSKIQCGVKGVEMEGSAIGAVADVLRIPWMIVVKGVSDYADHNKDDQFREYAAEAAARFLIAFLKEHLPSV